MDLQMINLKENALQLALKHDLHQEVKLIEQEEQRLINLLKEERAANEYSENFLETHQLVTARNEVHRAMLSMLDGIENAPNQVESPNKPNQHHKLLKTTSGNHLISADQNKVHKKVLQEATERLFMDSVRRQMNL